MLLGLKYSVTYEEVDNMFRGSGELLAKFRVLSSDTNWASIPKKNGKSAFTYSGNLGYLLLKHSSGVSWLGRKNWLTSGIFAS